MRIFLSEWSLAWLCSRELVAGKPRTRGRSWYAVLKADVDFGRAFRLLHGNAATAPSVYQVTKIVLARPGLSEAEVKRSSLYRKLCRFERWLKERASEAVGYDPSAASLRLGCRSFEQMMEDLMQHQDEYEILTYAPFVETLPRWERRRVLESWRASMRKCVEVCAAAANGDVGRVAQLWSWYWLDVERLPEQEVCLRVGAMVGASLTPAQVRAWAVTGERIVAQMKQLSKG